MVLLVTLKNVSAFDLCHKPHAVCLADVRPLGFIATVTATKYNPTWPRQLYHVQCCSISAGQPVTVNACLHIL